METESDIIPYELTSKIKPFSFGDELVTKTLRDEDVYKEIVLSQKFIEGL